MHTPELLITLSVGLVAALLCGYAMQRLKLSPIIGYLLAGVAIGPNTPGFVANQAIANDFAEIGVILLMFGVGLHFHWKDLIAVLPVALPGAIGQSVIATLLGTLLALASGLTLGAGLVLGVGVSVASTVVLIRVLSDNDRLDSLDGRIAVGWLVVEDIFTVLVLVVLPAVAGTFGAEGGGAVLPALGEALLRIAILAVLVLVLGARVIPWLLLQVARTRSRELFSLTVLAIALAIATGSAHFFGASLALGAFLAGMVVSQSPVSHQAGADALPMRDAFAVLFFVSVGMLFDFGFLLEQPGLVLGVLAIILVGKPLAALVIVALRGYSVRTALTVAVGLAQIGEFSFILAAVARDHGVLPQAGQSVLVAAALISISINPLLFRPLPFLERWLRGKPRIWNLLNRRAETRGRAVTATTAAAVAATNDVHAVVVGYGPVGQTVALILKDFEIRTVIIDLNVDTATRLAAEGQLSIYGDAAQREILVAAGIQKARFLIVTLPDLKSRTPVIVTARALNPTLKILVRARYLSERDTLEQLGATAVCYEEAEAAVALAEILLREVGATDDRLAREAHKIRSKFALAERGGRQEKTVRNRKTSP